MSDQFLRFPPDSTGKRVGHLAYIEIIFNNGTIPFVVGDIVTTPTTLLRGTVVKVTGTTSAGDIHVLLDPDSTEAVNIGEALQVSAVTRATSTTVGIPIFIQKYVMVGGDNPQNPQFVDTHGSAYTRFSEGSPTFDSFGKLQVSQQSIVAEYLNMYEIDTDKMSVILSGSGAATHLPSSSGILMSVGTASGASAKVVSNQYHRYQLGQSRLIEFTNASGDTGKTGLMRAWGYGDDTDGCFFMQDNGVWHIHIKSTASGVQTDTIVPQTAWNKDRLDGSKNNFNKSGAVFDITKDNITWIDLQWLGAGTVRFGVIVNGVRIICHEQHNTNSLTIPYMRTASLPVFSEIRNTAITASSSEFRIWCTVVKNEGALEAPSKHFSYPDGVQTINSTTVTPLYSLRSKQLLNGITNRRSAYLTESTCLSVSAPVFIEVWRNATLTGATWAISPNTKSSVEIDEGASAITGGTLIYSTLIDQTGIKEIDFSGIFNSSDEGIRRKYDSVLSEVYTITARRLTGATATDVAVSTSWHEI